MNLKLAWLYPDLMDTYGDRGNIQVLSRRCLLREIEMEVMPVSLGEAIPNDVDLIFMGGAQDRQQKIVIEDLKKEKAESLRQMIEEGRPALFVCAGFQLLGNYYQPAEGEKIMGLGIFDLMTQHPGAKVKRLIGNVVVDHLSFTEDKRMTLVGFENHGGRTYLGKLATPLGRVKIGLGNNGEDKNEGIQYKNAIGSYLHGPILPKNPHLSEYLLRKALERKYGEVILEDLDDTLAWKAHAKAKQIARH